MEGQPGHRPRRSRGLCRLGPGSRFDDPYVGKVPVALVHVEPVPDHKLSGDPEALVAKDRLVDTVVLTNQKCADLEACRVPGQQVAPQVVERQAAVDDVLDEDDVATSQVQVEILDYAYDTLRAR